MNMYSLLLAKKLSGGGGGSSTLVEKTITANGTYNPADDNADGYSSVTANVPNTYTLADEGKVVDSGALVGQTAKNIDANGLYDTTLNNSVNVSVPNSYTVADEGKVVSQGDLVSQSSRNIDANGTYDTTLNNSVDVSVPNTYTAGDEGKVVSSGALVSQTATSCNANGTIDTTLNNSVVVDVPNTYTAQDNGKVVVDQALVAQTAYPSTITVNNTYDTTNYNSVTVNVPTGGGGDDVIFIDYDGTVVYSYSKSDFLALTELPANPTHTGLSAQGWNWTLADAKTYVTDYDELIIGQTYITDDGKTRVYVNIPSAFVNVSIGTRLTGTGTVNINWGDGSTTEQVSVSGTTSATHIYSVSGDYVITYDVVSFTTKIGFYAETGYAVRSYVLYNAENSNLTNAVKLGISKIELGSNWAIKSHGFARCYGLQTITIPTGTTFNYNPYSNSDEHIFSDDYNLKSVVLPSNVGFVPHQMCINAYNMRYISLSHGVTRLGNEIINNCHNVKRITIPNTVAHLGLLLINATNIKTLTIPSSVTTNTIRAGGATKLTTIKNYSNTHWVNNQELFANCKSLCTFSVPTGTTTINLSAFSGCSALTHVDIANTVTSIGDKAFASCVSLREITIPASVTSINTTAFQNCANLATITINKVQDSISGAPWGATNATVVWTG